MDCIYLPFFLCASCCCRSWVAKKRKEEEHAKAKKNRERRAKAEAEAKAAAEKDAEAVLADQPERSPSATTPRRRSARLIHTTTVYLTFVDAFEGAPGWGFFFRRGGAFFRGG